ncbi:MAG: hypothetical protein Q7K21_03130, partial [Elusimicrobiota bacterium]|nr:hypothetical protein [Elusimicrobiota bacterium]
LIPIFFPNLLFSIYLGAKRIPFCLGLETEEKYLEREFEYKEIYDIVKYINKEIPKNKKIIFLGAVLNPQYYCPNHTLIGGYFELNFFHKDIDSKLKKLKGDNIEYIVIPKEVSTYFSSEDLLWFSKDYKKYLDLIYSNSERSIYKFKDKKL